MVVIKSALELSRGLTRLSGSIPNLKVMKVAEIAIKLTIIKDRKLTIISRPKIDPKILNVIPSGNIAIPSKLIAVIMISDAVIIPAKLIVKSLLLNVLSDGFIVPKCNLVVLVLAKIEL